MQRKEEEQDEEEEEEEGEDRQTDRVAVGPRPVGARALPRQTKHDNQ